MKIIIETKSFDSLRYCTLGDYFYDKDGALHIEIAETGNDDFNWCIMQHELFEEKFTRKHGIAEEDIYKFDLWVEEEVKAGRYPDDAEPGEHELSPYLREHTFAENMERFCAYELGLNWDEYCKELNKIF